MNRTRGRRYPGLAHAYDYKKEPCECSLQDDWHMCHKKPSYCDCNRLGRRFAVGCLIISRSGQVWNREKAGAPLYTKYPRPSVS